ncbi:MAG: hypothetical protein M1361_01360 [Patescibacteria group bacterium]|nr:hypothetical protein [Patescibacteria group bacterium]MCL5224247.1 hypothetical protein [Patescibacteria group bacterium]
MTKNNKGLPIRALLWRDAGYVFTKNPAQPDLQLTTGLIIEENDEFVNIAVNVDYNPRTHKIFAVDGFIIPKGAIVKTEEIYSVE